MKTLEDYQKREKHLIKYIESQIRKEEKQISYEGFVKVSAYKDILFKLTYVKTNK